LDYPYHPAQLPGGLSRSCFQFHGQHRQGQFLGPRYTQRLIKLPFQHRQLPAQQEDF